MHDRKLPIACPRRAPCMRDPRRSAIGAVDRRRPGRRIARYARSYSRAGRRPRAAPGTSPRELLSDGLRSEVASVELLGAARRRVGGDASSSSDRASDAGDIRGRSRMTGARPCRRSSRTSASPMPSARFAPVRLTCSSSRVRGHRAPPLAAVLVGALHRERADPAAPRLLAEMPRRRRDRLQVIGRVAGGAEGHGTGHGQDRSRSVPRRSPTARNTRTRASSAGSRGTATAAAHLRAARARPLRCRVVWDGRTAPL